MLLHLWASGEQLVNAISDMQIQHNIVFNTALSKKYTAKSVTSISLYIL